MKTLAQIGIDDLKEHLLKNWMTHDGLWFYQVFRQYGIEAANRLNKATIKALAGFETQRARQLMGMKQGPLATFAELKDFLEGAFLLSTDAFMGFTHDWPAENVLRWSFQDGSCFAYKGMRRLGVADRYECGVLYRVLCWIELAGVRYEASPGVEGCLQHTEGKCAGEVRLFFS